MSEPLDGDLLLEEAEDAYAELQATPRWRFLRRWRLRTLWLNYTSLVIVNEQEEAGRRELRKAGYITVLRVDEALSAVSAVGGYPVDVSTAFTGHGPVKVESASGLFEAVRAGLEASPIGQVGIRQHR